MTVIVVKLNGVEIFAAGGDEIGQLGAYICNECLALCNDLLPKSEP